MYNKKAKFIGILELPHLRIVVFFTFVMQLSQSLLTINRNYGVRAEGLAGKAGI
jgi:hypothetical protein